MFYFGCIGQVGHHLWDENLHTVPRWSKSTPWGVELDSSLCPTDEGQVQGQALIHHRDSWTALAFWDRSIDHRGGSNSVFVTSGVSYSFDEMLEMAKEKFPQVLKRYGFPIVELKP